MYGDLYSLLPFAPTPQLFTLIELVGNGEFVYGDDNRCTGRGLLIDHTIRNDYRWEDDDIKKMDAELFPYYQELYKKANTFRKLGKDYLCFLEEIAALQALVEYFILMKEQTGQCSSLEKFEEVYEDFKIACVREELKCKYGSNASKFVDLFIDMLGLRVPLSGIGYMAIDDDDCQVFTIHP